MSCFGCEVKEIAGQTDVDQLIREQLSVEIDRAAAAIVEKRIARCEACPFRSKHTCTKCGCYYKFRANLASKACPVHYW